MLGRGYVGESPNAEDNQVKEESANGNAEEILDKGTGTFVQAFDNDIVQKADDDSEIEWQEWEYGLEMTAGKP